MYKRACIKNANNMFADMWKGTTIIGPHRRKTACFTDLLFNTVYSYLEGNYKLCFIYNPPLPHLYLKI